MNIFLTTAPTAGREIKVVELLTRWNKLEETIQKLADEGYDLIGQIGEYWPTGTFGHPSKTYLFVRDREPKEVEG